MKKQLFIIAISTVLWSCGGGGGGETPTPEPPVNKAPTVPVLSAPTNNLLCIDNVLNFTWGASTDPEGNTITYTIEISKNNTFTQIAHTLTSNTPSKSITLDKGIAYYWRVKAIDSKGASSDYSATFQFYTEGVGVTNHLPFSPSLVSPTLNEVVNDAPKKISLLWNASDSDTSDTLTYDVFFGIVNPPTTKIGDNISAKTLEVSLGPSTKYYWYVVVKDNKGGKPTNGQTTGQVWNFVTD